MSIYKISAISLMTFMLLAEFNTAVAGDLSIEDAKVIGTYPLTMDKVQRKFAVAADLARQSVTDPALESQMQTVNNVATLDGQIKALGAIPKAAATLQAHGITARDYSLTTLAVNYAQRPQMPAQFRPANSPPIPSLIAAPADHVAFVQAHLGEIHKMTEAIMQARKSGQH